MEVITGTHRMKGDQITNVKQLLWHLKAGHDIYYKDKVLAYGFVWNMRIRAIVRMIEAGQVYVCERIPYEVVI